MTRLCSRKKKPPLLPGFPSWRERNIISSQKQKDNKVFFRERKQKRTRTQRKRQKTPTNKANTPNAEGTQKDDFKREKSFKKKKICQRDDSPTSDVETGIPTRERKLEEDVESGVLSYDQNISPDSRHPSSMQNHSPLARQWRRTSWSIVRISSSTVFLGITKERRMTDRLEKQLRMKMRRPSWLNAPFFK